MNDDVTMPRATYDALIELADAGTRVPLLRWALQAQNDPTLSASFRLQAYRIALQGTEAVRLDGEAARRAQEILDRQAARRYGCRLCRDGVLACEAGTACAFRHLRLDNPSDDR